jgi:hypothetical protein
MKKVSKNSIAFDKKYNHNAVVTLRMTIYYKNNFYNQLLTRISAFESDIFSLAHNKLYFDW